MKVRELPLSGALLIEPDVLHDSRGFFVESFNRAKYAARGLTAEFVQDNHSRSGQGVLRGIHLQAAPDRQAKLVRCTRGEIYDVMVDLNPASSTFGHWHGETLDADAMKQLYLPEGFGHGFVVTSDGADVQYKTTAPYNPAAECVVRWDDPAIAIEWPVAEPILSQRDRAGLSLSECRVWLTRRFQGS